MGNTMNEADLNDHDLIINVQSHLTTHEQILGTFTYYVATTDLNDANHQQLFELTFPCLADDAKYDHQRPEHRHQITGIFGV